MTDAPATGGTLEDGLVASFVAALRTRFGPHVRAVLLYGSYVRGKRDTVLDFYVLLDSYAPLPRVQRWANQLLAPNVYHLTVAHDQTAVAAKFATITLDRFAQAIQTDVDPYFWARFAQPCLVAYACDSAVAARIEALARVAAGRMIASTAPLLADPFSSAELWQRAFALTYSCELRAEDSAAGARLYAAYASALDAVTSASAAELGLEEDRSGRWHRKAAAVGRAQAASRWHRRRLLGKSFAVARLLKAAFTFNDPLGYVVWKVARHSGVSVVPSARARRHPLLFGWGVLWELYRKGGFR